MSGVCAETLMRQVAAAIDPRVTASLGTADWAINWRENYARVNPSWLAAIIGEARAVRAALNTAADPNRLNMAPVISFLKEVYDSEHAPMYLRADADQVLVEVFGIDHGPDGDAEHEGCDCLALCSMGPTCPGGGLAGLPGAGCWRTEES